MIVTKQAVLNRRDRQTERAVIGFLATPLALLASAALFIAV